MKKRFYCLLLTFFALSCSKEEADMDGDKNKETENKDIKIILEADKSCMCRVSNKHVPI